MRCALWLWLQVNYKVSNKTHLHLTRMVGIGYNSSFLTFATVNYLQLMSPPFPITVTTMYSPTFNVFNLFNNITLIPVLDQTDMMSALDGLQASPSPFATALVLWRNVTLDPKTWPVNGYSIYTTQASDQASGIPWSSSTSQQHSLNYS